MVHGVELRRSRRRAVLCALAGGSLAGLAGCTALLDDGCSGVALALELTPSKSGEQDVLDCDRMDLTQQERDISRHSWRNVRFIVSTAITVADIPNVTNEPSAVS